MARLSLVVFVVVAGCSKPGPQPMAPSPTGPARPAGPAASASAELSPALTPLAWWLGDWDASDGNGSEHWVAAAGALYGVALHGETFEVLIVDDGDGKGKPDGVLRLYAMPNGARMVEFRQRAVGNGSATFGNDEHDFPKLITYAITADRAGLTAVLDGSKQGGSKQGGSEQGGSEQGGSEQIEYRFARGTRSPAPELEAADLAFCAATAQRGVAGWVTAFDPRGGMMSESGRIEHDEIAAAMTETLTAAKVDWAPIASGKSGALGFTVGKATFTGASPEHSWRSTYVTIWHRQPDGSWKVLFDTGRTIQDG
jgi:hypothetical protein